MSTEHAQADVLGEAARGFVELIGAEIVEATADRAVVCLDVKPHHLQPHGVLHGGVHCTLVETAASVGGYVWLGGAVVGVNNNTDFLRPVTGGRITATASPIQRGRTQQLWLVEITGADGKLAARGQVRLHNVEARG
jgi:uncharacterized protein (TIGR00369 family)